MVETTKEFGMLQHIRDSRLIPYRLGCDCLYDHPALKYLLVGRQHRRVWLSGNHIFTARTISVIVACSTPLGMSRPFQGG